MARHWPCRATTDACLPDRLFADTRSAYEDLPKAMKNRLESPVADLAGLKARQVEGT